MNETYLQHYGVKNMKWGVRKDRKKSSRRSKRGRKNPVKTSLIKGANFVNENKFELLTIGLSVLGLSGAGAMVTIGRRIASHHLSVPLSSIT